MPKKKGQPAAVQPETTATAPAVPDHLLQAIDPETAAKPAKKRRAKAAKPAPAAEPAAADDDSSVNLDDAATDQAVNDIAVDEADTILTLQDVANETEVETKPRPKQHWFMLIVLMVVLTALIFYYGQLVDFYQTLNLDF